MHGGATGSGVSLQTMHEKVARGAAKEGTDTIIIGAMDTITMGARRGLGTHQEQLVEFAERPEFPKSCMASGTTWHITILPPRHGVSLASNTLFARERHNDLGLASHLLDGHSAYFSMHSVGYRHSAITAGRKIPFVRMRREIGLGNRVIMIP